MKAKKSISGEVLHNELVQLSKTDSYIFAVNGLAIAHQTTIVNPDGHTKWFIPNRYEALNTQEIMLLKSYIQIVDLESLQFNQTEIEQISNKIIELLSLYHSSLTQPALEKTLAMGAKGKMNSLEALKEASFYSAQTAHSIQLLALSPPRYKADSAKLKSSEGFSIEEATAVFLVAFRLLTAMHSITQSTSFEKLIYTNILEKDVLSSITGIDAVTVESVLNRFSQSSMSTCTDPMQRHYDLMHKPFIKLPDGKFLLLSQRAAAQSLYEAPYIWLVQDDDYKQVAIDNRAAFCEMQTREYIRRLFPSENIHESVLIKKGKAIVGELDVLVFHGGVAVCLECKTKAYTIQARLGDSAKAEKDIEDGLKKASDQISKRISQIESGECRLILSDGTELKKPTPIERYFPIVVVSEEYPISQTIVRQYLDFTPPTKSSSIFFTDLFFLDVITQFSMHLIYFLDFIEKRGIAAEAVVASTDFPIFSYYLKRNLVITDDQEFNMIILEDAIADDIDHLTVKACLGHDVTMELEGFQSWFRALTLGKIIESISEKAAPGFYIFSRILLSLSGEVITDLESKVNSMIRRSRVNGKDGDLTLVEQGNTRGLTLHITDNPTEASYSKLENHAKLRKNTSRVNEWCAIMIQSVNLEPCYGLASFTPWSALTLNGIDPTRFETNLSIKPRNQYFKVGRNKPCPCGSGKKYKKCCLI